jgi:hypothetical protein
MNGIQIFNQLKSTAKEMGIDTKGLNKVQLEEAIAAKSKPEIYQVIIGTENTPMIVEKKKGRPVLVGSKRQEHLNKRKERVEKNGGVVKRGRPTVEGSARQTRVMRWNELKANGVEIKRGRPKVVKTEQLATAE